MPSNNKNFSFIISHTTRNRAFIRRIEVSRNLVKAAGVTMSAFVLAFSVLAFSGFLSTSIAGLMPEFDSMQSPELASASLSPKVRLLNYSRPTSSFDFAQNSGGPFDGNFQLTATDSEKETDEIEKRLRRIEELSNPIFLPTIWAHLGKINNEFGFRRNPFGGRSYEFHSGMDIDGERGDIIVAPANGKIVQAGYKGGYGYMIEIDHGNGLTTRFGHMSKLSVKDGDPIERGQLIGFVGSTGRSTGPHLHYELRLDGKPINPRRFLPPEPTELEG